MNKLPNITVTHTTKTEEYRVFIPEENIDLPNFLNNTKVLLKISAQTEKLKNQEAIRIFIEMVSNKKIFFTSRLNDAQNQIEINFYGDDHNFRFVKDFQNKILNQEVKFEINIVPDY